MDGNPQVIAALNGLLADELAAWNQYLAHYGAAANWGFDGLAALIRARAEKEHEHADELIARILALGGVPLVLTVGEVNTTLESVPAQMALDADAEQRAIAKYNAAIVTAATAGDNATRVMLDANVVEETAHLNEIEGWQDQIGMIGLAALIARIEG